MPRRKLTLDPRFETPPNTRILNMEDMGGLVRLRRRELGMTQADVSRLTGFSMRLVGEIERGKEHVSADKLLRLLDVLNMTMTVHVEGK
ncbi:MAG: helix-turn-helix transcriptional regulator [Atopobiaceae bacterium]|nr:helix-turn-helix transcriptional regulator [Atopobiaceae bacterium]MDO4403445.1 helix-turn-helix domain-containing protein [Atopobiaceae bacterium]